MEKKRVAGRCAAPFHHAQLVASLPKPDTVSLLDGWRFSAGENLGAFRVIFIIRVNFGALPKTYSVAYGEQARRYSRADTISTTSPVFASHRLSET